MSDQVGGGITDAAAVGLAFAFPDGLRGQMAALAEAWAPVDEAVAAGSAGLVELGMMTADLNGSAAVARPIGAGRVRRRTGELAGPVQTIGQPVVDPGASAVEVAEVRRPAVGIVGDEAAMAPAVQVDARGDVGGDSVRDDFRARASGPEMAMPGARVTSSAPVGAGMGFGPAVAAVETGNVHGMAGQESVAPVTSPVMVTVERGGVQAAGFETSSGQSGIGMIGRGVAPEGGVLTGLRADVGAALAERAATRSPAGAAPVSAGSAAFVGNGARGSQGETMELGLGESSGTPGSEAAWAPQPAGRGTGGSGGDGMGIVQLDGRLVGQWLSEGMAREAARPGAGTTFFDPRQAPAWTPSGSL